MFEQLKNRFGGGLEIHLVEASSKMIALQYHTLTDTAVMPTATNPPSCITLDNGVTVTWYRHISEVPKGMHIACSTVCTANDFISVALRVFLLHCSRVL